ncbi:DoxX family protein [Lentzea flaviverrucosa]|uniref:DoxX-like family protein n=1 Tax=Lentzea flaviverrucosa TaxID=200379 RepID=A0A1H9H3H5_9PSEU|nr:DoxX family protein [Lentzea flaviverrucosa]RDI34713.1 DoxX-like protein [Lentzea flaviverrucosa]SEQ56876.1 DoxX-like family protein [Lentzea flaviverrucosa]
MIVELVTIALNAAAATADFAGAEFVRDNARKLDLPSRWILPLGVLKAAGALGLAAGLAGVPCVGVAAAGGLTLFFVGAVALHVWRKALRDIGYPAAFLGLAIASLVSQW